MSQRYQSKSIFGESDDMWSTIRATLGKVSPKLVQEIDADGDGEPEIRREVDPIAVTRLGGTLPFDTDSKQLQCGETITRNDGDENIRLVMEAVITESQRETLMEMRSDPEVVKLVSAAYTGPAIFDELKWDRKTDANGAVSRTHGEIDEPIHKIQLQSKQNSES
jgi:hypothetical protein